MPDTSQAGQTAKPDSSAPAPAAVAAPIPPAPVRGVTPPPVSMPQSVITLDDYAVSKSASERRVELLNAFVAMTQRKGMTIATAAAFDAEFAAFANAPV